MGRDGKTAKGAKMVFLAWKEFYWLLGLGLWLKSTTRGEGEIGMEASSLPYRRIEKGGKPLLSANWSIPPFRFQNLANHRGRRLGFVCGPLIIEAVDLVRKRNWLGKAWLVGVVCSAWGILGFLYGRDYLGGLVGLVLLLD